MRKSPKVSLAATLLVAVGAAAAQVVFYENEDFQGRTFTATAAVDNFANTGFNDRASSIRVERGNWEVCQDSGFAGRCVMLREGGYPTLAAMGLQDRVSSVRRVDGYRDNRDNQSSQWQRRGNERLYEANVQNVRAVMGPPDRRCWLESQARDGDRRDNRDNNDNRASGVLAHQVGNLRDAATVAGVGSAVQVAPNRGDGPQLATQDVRRCGDVPNVRRTDYWDVTYTFRGQGHRVQMSMPPGPTITVNRQGEPREPRS